MGVQCASVVVDMAGASELDRLVFGCVCSTCGLVYHLGLMDL